MRQGVGWIVGEAYIEDLFFSSFCCFLYVWKSGVGDGGDFITGTYFSYMCTSDQLSQIYFLLLAI